jgi:glutaredoxin-like YruB-family protein
MPAAQPQVTIYSTPSCHFCHAAKEFFTEHHVAFTDVDVAANAEERQKMIEKSGTMGVPQIYVGDQFVLGFDEPKLRKLLAIT